MSSSYEPGIAYYLLEADFGDRDLYRVWALVSLIRPDGVRDGDVLLAQSIDTGEVVVCQVPWFTLEITYLDRFHTLADGYRQLAQRLTAYADGAREPAEIACRTPRGCGEPVTITRQTAAEWIGSYPTDREWSRVKEALPHSSLPDVIAAVFESVRD